MARTSKSSAKTTRAKNAKRNSECGKSSTGSSRSCNRTRDCN